MARNPIPARALVLTPLPAHGTNVKVAVTVLIVLPDGSTTAGAPYFNHSQFNGVIRPGTWVPVTLEPGKPVTAKLDTDHIPTVSQVARVMAEALGGPAVDPVPPDEWRIILALGYAEHVIASAAFTPDQAQAIRQRIKRGVLSSAAARAARQENSDIAPSELQGQHPAAAKPECASPAWVRPRSGGSWSGSRFPGRAPRRPRRDRPRSRG